MTTPTPAFRRSCDTASVRSDKRRNANNTMALVIVLPILAYAIARVIWVRFVG